MRRREKSNHEGNGIYCYLLLEPRFPRHVLTSLFVIHCILFLLHSLIPLTPPLVLRYICLPILQLSLLTTSGLRCNPSFLDHSFR